MMGKMRDMAKWVLYILIIAFIALMVFEWGADYSGQAAVTSNVVGEVNGTEITWNEFDRAVQFATTNEQNRTGESPDIDQTSRIRDQVWEDVVRRLVLKDKIEDLNIQVSDMDIYNYIINNPGQQVTQSPEFQTNGVYDPALYKDALRNPEFAPYLSQQEQSLRAELPYIKLEQMVTASVVVTELEAREEFSASNVKANVDFLTVQVNAFRDQTEEVTDEEAQRYYNDHREDYEQKERRVLNYVFFSTDPTSADSGRTYSLAETLQRRIQDGEDIGDLAVEYSQDPSVRSNRGDLGFFEKSAMVAPFAEAAFAAEVGDVISPVETRFGIHIIQVFDRKEEDGKEQVKASHILLNFETGGETLDAADFDSRAFREKVEEIGFVQAADEMSLQIQETPEFPENTAGQLPGLARNKSAMTWAFRAEIGDYSEIFFSKSGRFVCELVNTKPGGHVDFELVKENCRNKVKLEKQKEMARVYAEALASRVAGGEDFSAIAASDTSGKVTADTTGDFGFRSYVPKVGLAPQLVAAAFGLPEGQSSDLLSTDRGFYYIRVKGKTEFNEDEYKNQRTAIRNRLLQTKRRNAFNQWYQGLKEDAEIEDNRYLFYRS